MTDFITLTCPNCGGKLEITKDLQQFACAHCGTEHRVNRSASVISLTPFVDGIKKVQIGVDKTASELAIVRLKDEIALLENEYEDKYSYRNWLIKTIIVWGIGSLVGIFFLVRGIQFSSTSLIIIGIIVAGFGIFQVYKFYSEYIALDKKMHNALAESRKKNKELIKHQAIVSG